MLSKLAGWSNVAPQIEEWCMSGNPIEFLARILHLEPPLSPRWSDINPLLTNKETHNSGNGSEFFLEGGITQDKNIYTRRKTKVLKSYMNSCGLDVNKMAY